jgi:class 3 adenylate cyclase
LCEQLEYLTKQVREQNAEIRDYMKREREQKVEIQKQQRELEDRNEELERQQETLVEQSRRIQAINAQLADNNLLLSSATARSEALLLNILPASIKDRLQKGETVIADYFPEVTVIFADIIGFTDLSARHEPETIVQMFNWVFSIFDGLTERFGLEKIKTIGVSLSIPLDSVFVQEFTPLCSSPVNFTQGKASIAITSTRPDITLLRWGFGRSGTSFTNCCSSSVQRMYTNFQTPVSVRQEIVPDIFSVTITPNPTSQPIHVHFSLPSPANVRVEFIDMLGRTTLPPITEERGAGEHSTALSVEGLSSGVYSVRLTVRTAAGVRSETVRLMVVR